MKEEEKGKKEELQSRRAFFKKVAKTTLPILGAIALTSVPLVSNAAPQYNCGYSCSMSCKGGCEGCSGTCRGGCQYACGGNCSGRCSGTCRSLCSSSSY